MDFLSGLESKGHSIELKQSDPRHLTRSSMPVTQTPASPEEGFGALFFKAIGQVNDLQQKSMNLTQSMITDPDSVNIHDITIAIAEANLSLSMTKTIMDRAIRAYREIINTR